MKPPPFDYHALGTVAEACGLLATLENAKVLAGGQSLMAKLNLRSMQPDHVIDINRIAGLGGTHELPRVALLHDTVIQTMGALGSARSLP